MGIETPTYCQASTVTGLSVIMILQYIPITEFKAIKTMDVGVAVFSVTRKSNFKMLKQQISSPVPERPVKIPPTKPG